MPPVTAAVMAGVKSGKYKDRRAKLVASRLNAKRVEQIYSSSGGTARNILSSYPDEQKISSTPSKLFKKYDTDCSGKLDVNELTELLKQYSSESPDQLLSPSEAEASWIIEAAGKSKKDSITITELELALQLWDSYVKHRAEISQLSERCDTGNGSRLNFDQLKLYLSNLKVRPPKVNRQSDDFTLLFLI
jgi:Ca2+-binding EF-hand superfamily protein